MKNLILSVCLSSVLAFAGSTSAWADATYTCSTTVAPAGCDAAGFKIVPGTAVTAGSGTLPGLGFLDESSAKCLAKDLGGGAQACTAVGSSQCPNGASCWVIKVPNGTPLNAYTVSQNYLAKRPAFFTMQVAPTPSYSCSKAAAPANCAQGGFNSVSGTVTEIIGQNPVTGADMTTQVPGSTFLTQSSAECLAASLGNGAQACLATGSAQCTGGQFGGTSCWVIKRADGGVLNGYAAVQNYKVLAPAISLALTSKGNGVVSQFSTSTNLGQIHEAYDTALMGCESSYDSATTRQQITDTAAAQKCMLSVFGSQAKLSEAKAIEQAVNMMATGGASTISDLLNHNVIDGVHRMTEMTHGGSVMSSLNQMLAGQGYSVDPTTGNVVQDPAAAAAAAKAAQDAKAAAATPENLAACGAAIATYQCVPSPFGFMCPGGGINLDCTSLFSYTDLMGAKNVAQLKLTDGKNGTANQAALLAGTGAQQLQDLKDGKIEVNSFSGTRDSNGNLTDLTMNTQREDATSKAVGVTVDSKGVGRSIATIGYTAGVSLDQTTIKNPNGQTEVDSVAIKNGVAQGSDQYVTYVPPASNDVQVQSVDTYINASNQVTAAVTSESINGGEAAQAYGDGTKITSTVVNGGADKDNLVTKADGTTGHEVDHVTSSSDTNKSWTQQNTDANGNVLGTYNCTAVATADGGYSQVNTMVDADGKTVVIGVATVDANGNITCVDTQVGKCGT